MSELIKKEDGDAARLTDEQRRLVSENVGLVYVHLRRHVSGLWQPRRDRERDDLFQEGCLGLMKAAVRFREERGIPFAAFALPRIHNAISRALHIKFSTVYVPPRRSDKKPNVADSASPSASPDARERRFPIVVTLSDAQSQCLTSHSTTYSEAKDTDTLGDRLREKYERAVQRAVVVLSDRSSRRGDRARLIETLVAQRYLVPDEDSKSALRQIARETDSSYARVAQCDKQIGQTIRDLLEDDPEFELLRRQARRNPDGNSQPIDELFERRLAATSAKEFVRRLRRADDRRRGDMVADVLAAGGDDLGDVMFNQVVNLPRSKRERLWFDGRTPSCDRRRRSEPLPDAAKEARDRHGVGASERQRKSKARIGETVSF